jgi:hypothetical protein
MMSLSELLSVAKLRAPLILKRQLIIRRCSMTIPVLASCPHALLASGILIVEPHAGLLTAPSMLLAASDHYLGVSNYSENQAGRSEECEVAIACPETCLARYLFLQNIFGIRSRRRQPSWQIAEWADC